MVTNYCRLSGRVLSVPVFFIILTLSFGCSKHEPTPKESPPETAFQSALRISETYPLANGGAYLVGYGEKVFFINGDRATPVKGLHGLVAFDVCPLADGTALLIDEVGNPPTMYHLQDDIATPIRESTEILGASFSGDLKSGFLLAEISRLRKKVKDLKSDQESPREEGPTP